MEKQLDPKDTALLVHIEHSKPIEVSDFVATLTSVSNLYSSYIKKNADCKDMTSAKLYVEKIEKGCIDIHLCELASAAFIPFAENANTILDFAKHIKDIVSYYINGKGSEPKFSVSDLKALHDLFAVSANDRKSETTIGAIYKSEKGDIYNNCTFNYGNSNSAQNQINKEIECLNNSEPEDSIYHRVLMQIYQVRSDADSNTGNKAIIDEIFKGKKVSLLFDSDELKNEILFSNSNPTRTGYQVDVKVQTINGKPQAYKVLALHDTMELSD